MTPYKRTKNTSEGSKQKKQDKKTSQANIHYKMINSNYDRNQTERAEKYNQS